MSKQKKWELGMGVGIRWELVSCINTKSDDNIEKPSFNDMLQVSMHKLMKLLGQSCWLHCTENEVFH